MSLREPADAADRADLRRLPRRSSPSPCPALVRNSLMIGCDGDHRRHPVRSPTPGTRHPWAPATARVARSLPPLSNCGVRRGATSRRASDQGAIPRRATRRRPQPRPTFRPSSTLADESRSPSRSVEGETPPTWRVAGPSPIRVQLARRHASERPGCSWSRCRRRRSMPTTNSVVRIMWFASGVGLAVVLLVAWLVVGLGLRPLRRMERSAASITGAADLGQRRAPVGAHRARPPRLDDQRDARPMLETSFSEQQATESPPAPLRRRAPATSARAAHLDPQLRRKPYLRAAATTPEQVQAQHGPHRARGGSAWATSSTTSCCSPAPMPSCPSTASRSTCAPSSRALAADTRVVDARPHDHRRRGRRAPSSATDAASPRRWPTSCANARIHTPAGTPIELILRSAAATAAGARDRALQRAPGRAGGRSTTATGCARAATTSCSSASTTPTPPVPASAAARALGSVDHRRDRRGPRRRRSPPADPGRRLSDLRPHHPDRRPTGPRPAQRDGDRPACLTSGSARDAHRGGPRRSGWRRRAQLAISQTAFTNAPLSVRYCR